VVVQSLTGTCSRTDWRKHPIQGEWSLLEIICHLRDVEREVNLPRFELLKNAVNPFILGVDTDRWAVERHYNDQDESTVYTDFCMNRSKLLEIIGRYSPSEWQSTLRHSFLVPPPVRSWQSSSRRMIVIISTRSARPSPTWNDGHPVGGIYELC